MIKILELFGGIGAPRKALENLNVDIKSIDYVEILPYAVQAYNQMFDNDYKPQDITSWNMNTDILIHGSPCQDWSKNGLNNINTGRSILYERTLEIIKGELNPKPRIVIWENVPNLLSDRHKHHFEHYLSEMESYGYQNSYKILNAKHFNVPQNRERVFTVSMLNGKKFIFPEQKQLDTKLKDFIDFDVDPGDYPLSDNEKSLFFEKKGQLLIHTNTKAGFQLVEEFDSINVERPNSKTRRGRIGKQVIQTITTSANQTVYYDGIVRRITPKEYFRLMGYSDDDYFRIKDSGINDRQITKLAGNSIVVQVLEAIFKELLKGGEEE